MNNASPECEVKEICHIFKKERCLRVRDFKTCSKRGPLLIDLWRRERENEKELAGKFDK